MQRIRFYIFLHFSDDSKHQDKHEHAKILTCTFLNDVLTYSEKVTVKVSCERLPINMAESII